MKCSPDYLNNVLSYATTQQHVKYETKHYYQKTSKHGQPKDKLARIVKKELEHRPNSQIIVCVGHINQVEHVYNFLLRKLLKHTSRDYSLARVESEDDYIVNTRFISGHVNILVTDHKHNSFRFFDNLETNCIILYPVPFSIPIYKQQTAKLGNLRIVSFFNREHYRDRIRYFKTKINLKKYRI